MSLMGHTNGQAVGVTHVGWDRMGEFLHCAKLPGKGGGLLLTGVGRRHKSLLHIYPCSCLSSDTSFSFSHCEKIGLSPTDTTLIPPGGGLTAMRM